MPQVLVVVALVTLPFASSGTAQGLDSVATRAPAVSSATVHRLLTRREVVVLGSLAAVAALASPFGGRGPRTCNASANSRVTYCNAAQMYAVR